MISLPPKRCVISSESGENNKYRIVFIVIWKRWEKWRCSFSASCFFDEMFSHLNLNKNFAGSCSLCSLEFMFVCSEQVHWWGKKKEPVHHVKVVTVEDICSLFKMRSYFLWKWRISSLKSDGFIAFLHRKKTYASHEFIGCSEKPSQVNSLKNPRLFIFWEK